MTATAGGGELQKTQTPEEGNYAVVDLQHEGLFGASPVAAARTGTPIADAGLASRGTSSLITSSSVCLRRMSMSDGWGDEGDVMPIMTSGAAGKEL